MATIRITATGLGDDSTALNDLIFKIYNGATDALITTTGSHTTDADVTVTGTTVVITNVDVGTLGAGDTVKIAATDDDGTPLTGTLSASYTITSGDVTAPTLSSATIEDAAPTNVVMVFSESVTMTDLVDNGFTLSGTTSTVFTSISGSGTTWTGVLGTAAANGETITISYSSVTGDVADTNSNALATFSGMAVINNVAGVTNLYITGTPASPVPNEGSTIPTGGTTTSNNYYVNGSRSSIAQDSVLFDNGTSSVRVESVATTGYNVAIWTLPVTIGKTYTITFRARPERSNAQVRCVGNFDTTVTTTIPTINTWQDVTLVTSAATATGIGQIYFDSNPSGAGAIGEGLNIDNLVIVENP